MATKDLFAQIDGQLKANAASIGASVDGIFKFNVTGGDAGVWIVDCKDNVGVREGDGDADCTITISDEDFAGIKSGELDGMQAFMMGKIEIDGDMGLAMKLQEIL